jgi:crotonobetainyl-CoA:carnitine CoA-transferase CaiB-like acyl-CoA transferase
MASSEAPPLLDGVRVLSLGTYVAGNVCALLLAGLGADVVKVDARDHPEALRAYDASDASRHLEPSGIPTTALYAGLTRGMRSVSVDMHDDGGREAFRSLVGRADVLVENLGAARMDEWGCSFETLRARSPRLVMLSISGYGRTGPLRGYRAYASSVSTYVGLTAAWAADGTYCDFVAGIQGVDAVVAGLTAVARGATGIDVDLAQTEAVAAVLAPLYLGHLVDVQERPTVDDHTGSPWLTAVARCSGSDAWVAVELEGAADWDTACRYLGRPDLTTAGADVVVDAAGVAGRRSDLLASLEGWTGGLSPLQAAQRLQRIGLAAAPVQNTEDIWRDPQLRSRGAFVEVQHPDLDVVEYPDAADHLDGVPGRTLRRAPRLGEHTREVLAEWLGLTSAEVVAWERRGAVWQAPG